MNLTNSKYQNMDRIKKKFIWLYIYILGCTKALNILTTLKAENRLN